MQNKDKTALFGIIAILTLVVLGLFWYMRTPTKTETVHTHVVTQTPQLNTSKKSKKIFQDGLGIHTSEIKQQPDETGTGITNIKVFNIDINSDGLMDKITKTHNENGTAHFWDDYKIELNKNGTWRNITPKGLRTTQGSECALQKVQFKFSPVFQVIKISRPWVESWTNPSTATKTVYTLKDDKLQVTSTEKMKTVCDVTELFTE